MDRKTEPSSDKFLGGGYPINSGSATTSEQTSAFYFSSPARERVTTVTAETSYLLEGGELKKGNSLSVIFSLWSTMIGSTLLAMPRVVRDTGIVSALIGTALVCMSNTYTVQLMERLGRFHGNNGMSVLMDAGRHVHIFATFVSVVVLLGANTIYQIYICDGLMKLSGVDSNDKTYRTVFAVGIGAVFFVVGLLKSLKPLFLAAGYAIVIVIFIVVFILVKSIQQLVNHDGCKETELTSTDLVWRGAGPFAQNCSTIALSLYIHSLVLPILNLATRPKNNPRDLVVAFIATAVSVVGPAALATYAFRYCNTISGDFLEMFDDPFTMVARVAIILLVGVVYPILLYNARGQLLGVIMQSDDYPYWSHMVFNLCAIALSTVPCALNIETTFVASTVGVCAIFWVTFLPVGMWYYHLKRREPESMGVVFYVVNSVVVLFGAVLVATTILSEATNLLN